MSIILIVLSFLAIGHFIYEAIIAPSLRLSVRFDLFALRDELRALKIEQGDALSNKHFEYLQDSINAIVLMLPRFDAGMLNSMNKELENNKELEAKVEARVKVLDDCVTPSVSKIREKSLRLAYAAFAINTGMLFLFLLPLIMLINLKKRLRSLVSLSKPDLEKIARSIGPPEIFAT